jgi:hypothetical protein
MKAMTTNRDHRLDLFRGIALLTIFVNHVPGTIYENFTSRNFGFSDAAESFVLMSGIASAFAYTKIVKGSIVEGFTKSAARSFKLYWVHLLITALAIVAVTGLSTLLGTTGMLDKNNFPAFLGNPVAGTAGILTLGHQLGYFNILPLYSILLLASPLAISMAVARPKTLLALSTGIWAVSGQYHLNLPTYPADGEWFLNPLSWQLIFTIGILIGVSVKEKRGFVGFDRRLYAAAALYLVFACTVVQAHLWDWIMAPDINQLFFGFDKTYLTGPRLLHVLALAYVAIHTPVFVRAASADWARPLRYLGKNSLAVFATGSVVCIVFQSIKEHYQFNALDDAMLLGAGLAVQYAAADWDNLASWLRERVSRGTPAAA